MCWVEIERPVLEPLPATRNLFPKQGVSGAGGPVRPRICSRDIAPGPQTGGGGVTSRTLTRARRIGGLPQRMRRDGAARQVQIARCLLGSALRTGGGGRTPSRLGALLQVEKLPAHHDPVEPRQDRSHQRVPEARSTTKNELDEKPAALRGAGGNHVGHHQGRKETRLAEAEREMTIGLQGDEVEDTHEGLTHGESLEPRSELARAPPTEVVDPVVAVRCYAKLAEPSEDDGRLGLDADASEVGLAVVGKECVAGEHNRPFLSGGSPDPDDLTPSVHAAVRVLALPCI